MRGSIEPIAVKHNLIMPNQLIVGGLSQIACHHQQEIWDSSINTLECCPFQSSFGHSKQRGDHAFDTVRSQFMKDPK